ncbi:MAG: SRPBCC family protein [Acidobacteriaceae bacterium]
MRYPFENSRESSSGLPSIGAPLALAAGLLGTYGAMRKKPALIAGAAFGVAAMVALRQIGENTDIQQDAPYEAVASFAIRCTAERAYRMWRDFETLPTFMRHLKSVTRGKDNESQWTAAGPLGSHLSWKAEIVDDVENERIAWRSLPGSPVATYGSIQFRPGLHEGSIVATLRMHYSLPGGTAGKAFATAFGKHPEFTVREDLRRFKALLEAGEIPTTAGQPHGPRGIHGRLQHMLLRESSNMAAPQLAEPPRRVA